MVKKLSKDNKPQILVILGTTSAGKTRLAVELADALGGEIVSADSRQVYRGLDVGTGKDLAEYRSGRRKIRYHLIDVADPRRQFNVARYQKLARLAIDDILRRGKLPIIVGGSGLYLQALVDNYKLPAARANRAQKIAWQKLSADQLYKELRRLKPEFADRLNNSDKNNPHRLVRYLEIASGAGEVAAKQESAYDWLILGLKVADKILRKRIRERLIRRLEKEGLVTEIENLHRGGLSWKRLKGFGLEYKFVSQYLLGELSYPLMVERLDAALWRFAKRQLVWFRRWEKQGRKIEWIKDREQAERMAKRLQ